MKKIGIFAGTFDPVHEGHIGFCQAAAVQLDLDKVYLLPERSPRGKQNVTDFAHRVALLELAVADYPELAVYTLNDDQFTVNATLPALQTAFENAQLTLLIGSDIACESLSYWDQLASLLAATQLAVGVRNTSSTDQVEQAMTKLLTTHGNFNYHIIDSPDAHISSSQIRSNSAALLPHLRLYAQTHGLYLQ